MTVAAGMLVTGCSQDVYNDADDRFPAPRLIQAKSEPVEQPARKNYRRVTPVVAQPAAPAARVADLPDANKTPAQQAVNAPAAQAPAVPTTSPAPIASITEEARASASGRRGTAEAPTGIGNAIEQAELLLRIGNIVGARSVLEPFVKSRHAEALAELGKTFDPIELEKFLVAPGIANAGKAIELYTEAAGRGSVVAKLRLERLQTAPTPVERQR